MPTAEHIAHLIYQDLEGKLSETESKELQDWRAENPEHQTFFEKILDEDGLAEMTRLHHPEHKEAIRKNVLAKIERELAFKVLPLYRRGFFRVAVAACIAALIGVGGYFTFFNQPGESEPPIAKVNDVEAPKTDKAVIQLADGTIIPVDSLSTYQQGNVKVTRLEDGRLVYSGLGTEVVFNTLTNPRGSKVIDMTLADGSRVWLNAGSSITYPIAFTGNERKLTMTGEGYFEITRNHLKPFTVSKNDMTVTVLGTKFNVNAYDDEETIKVTLLEGSVKANQTLIKPGEQAIVVNGETSVVHHIDVEAVMAWKNGFFQFNRSSVQEVMRQLARWYDVEVAYQGTIPERAFGGKINRDANLSQALKILEESNVHFRLEGRKITVLP